METLKLESSRSQSSFDLGHGAFYNEPEIQQGNDVSCTPPKMRPMPKSHVLVTAS